MFKDIIQFFCAKTHPVTEQLENKNIQTKAFDGSIVSWELCALVDNDFIFEAILEPKSYYRTKDVHFQSEGTLDLYLDGKLSGKLESHQILSTQAEHDDYYIVRMQAKVILN